MLSIMGRSIELLTALLLLSAGCSKPAAESAAPPAAKSSNSRASTMPAEDLVTNLKRHVTALAGEIGERNTRNPEAYDRAKRYLADELAALGFDVKAHEFEADGKKHTNLVAELPAGAKADEIIIIGAHYDSAIGTPGANDNASGVSATLEIAQILRHEKPARTIRFVLFANEEPPHFQKPSMGSQAYARKCFEDKEKVVAMLSLETMGYFADTPGSQKYPPQLKERYPDVGNFIGIVSDIERKEFVEDFTARLKSKTDFPIESAALPPLLPGVGWSDHWSFWQFDYPALMVTDTAPFRYPHYHKPTDTPDKLDYTRMAAVVEAVANVVRDLANE